MAGLALLYVLMAFQFPVPDVMNCCLSYVQCDAQRITSRRLTGHKLKQQGSRHLECFWGGTVEPDRKGHAKT
jgi:hypothetical protein